MTTAPTLDSVNQSTELPAPRPPRVLVCVSGRRLVRIFAEERDAVRVHVHQGLDADVYPDAARTELRAELPAPWLALVRDGACVVSVFLRDTSADATIQRAADLAFLELLDRMDAALEPLRHGGPGDE